MIVLPALWKVVGRKINTKLSCPLHSLNYGVELLLEIEKVSMHFLKVTVRECWIRYVTLAATNFDVTLGDGG